MEKIVILGGGLSGLSAAEILTKNGYDVTVLEIDSIPGGLAKSFQYKGKWIPMTYHHVLQPDKMTQKCIRDHGLEKYLQWKNVKMSFWYGKKGYPLTGAVDLLLFSPLSLTEKIKFGLFGVHCFLKSKWKDKEGMNAKRWIEKSLGKRITEDLFENLAQMKFGGLDTIDAAWMGERLHEAAKTGSKHAYLTCGFQEMVSRICKNIEKQGGKIMLSTVVKSVKGNEVTASTKGKEIKLKADKIINTLPLPVFIKVIEDLPENLRKKIKDIVYKPMVCAVGGSKTKLSKYYWHVFIKPKRSFGGIFNHTNLYKDGGIDGEELYYMFTYVDKDQPLFKMGEEEIKKTYLKDMKEINPKFEFTWFKAVKLEYSEPYFTMGFKNLPIKLTDNIYMAGVYKEYPSTRTMHTALKSGTKTANFILKEK